MTIRNTYAAEAWDKVYSAFTQINFTSYDYDTVKESLLQYLRIYHAEHFNDFIESSELIAILELFAYVAELLAYRVDTMTHENFITTAQRKQSVLRLARLISYRASRNIPARGLVKINTVRTTQDVYDSLGNNLANITISWNDPNNSNWKEQFFLVMNKSLTSPFGEPSKSYQISDVLMQLYTFNNNDGAFRNGVFAFSATGGAESAQMEAVPSDIDENGPFERAPDSNAQFNVLYASDGKGDGSDFTGFLMFVKQGTLLRTDYTILEPTANRRVELDTINVNDTDVWVYRVDDDSVITESWKRVETLNEQNLYFNDDTSTRKKYEVETLENDRIALLFGDGNFSDTPVGDFQLWTRVSANQNLTIPKNRIAGQQMQFAYTTQTNNVYTFNLSFSLTAAIQNNAASETVEHVRQAAPSTYYAQNRMVNGQDYNTFMLKDQTILRLKTVNRTFAGQPKYIEWNDASRTYENVKLFGDDLAILMDVSSDLVITRNSSKTIIDSFLEPLLQTTGLFNSLTHVLASSDSSYGIISYPRRRFIEDNRTIYRDVDGNYVNPYGKNLNPNTDVNLRTLTDIQTGDGSLNEKTVIQAALDQHWYGEPVSYATISGVRHGVIKDPILYPTDDGKLYVADLPRTIDGVNTYPPGDIGSNLQQVPRQTFFGLRFNRFLSAFGTGALTLHPNSAEGLEYHENEKEVLTLEMTSDATTFTVISNIRGKLPTYSLAQGGQWSAQTTLSLPVDFTISYDPLVDEPFAAGDAFVIDLEYTTVWTATVRTFGANAAARVNLNGWWELVPQSVITSATSEGGTGIFATGPDDGPSVVENMTFAADSYQSSWLFLIARKDDGAKVDSWYIYNRNMKIIAESLTTKFWLNQAAQIIDSETKKPVYDKIRILRSNLDETGKPLLHADIYDAVGFVYDADGVINYNQLEILPTDTVDWTQAGDTTPDNILQFETFSANSYQYGVVNDDGVTITWFTCGPNGDGSGGSYTLLGGYDIPNFDAAPYDAFGILYGGIYYAFEEGSYVGAVTENTTGEAAATVVRRRYAPAPSATNSATGDINGCNIVTGLDFMWQHFSPVTNLIDPSVSNIHDAFIMTRGYYDNMRDFVKGYTDIEPKPPTPLDLRTSYGYLLANKMLSDTVVLHSGSIKLLFGEKADQRFRAKFRVVRGASATFSDERIKAEIVDVIDTFFNIQNWDFGDKFYATELIALIHQRLATQIASVVIVPMYSVNSFGSLFTIDSGFDEVLQSAATVNDVEIVTALTPAVLRQTR